MYLSDNTKNTCIYTHLSYLASSSGWSVTSDLILGIDVENGLSLRLRKTVQCVSTLIAEFVEATDSIGALCVGATVL